MDNLHTDIKKQVSERQERYYRNLYRKDRLAARVINLAGYGVITSILAIFLFLLYQSFPLGKNARVEEIFSIPVHSAQQQVVFAGTDEYMELIYTLDTRGTLQFFRRADGQLLLTQHLPLDDNEHILSAAKGALHEEAISIGTDSGRVLTADIRFKHTYRDAKRVVEPQLNVGEAWSIASPGDSLPAHVELLAFASDEDGKQTWSWLDHPGNLHLRIYDSEYDEEYRFDLSDQVGEAPITALTLSWDGEFLLVGTRHGEVFWFDVSDPEDVSLKQQWTVSPGVPISSLRFLLGNQTLIIGNTDGMVESWFPVRTANDGFQFQRIHRFSPLPRAVTQIYASPRNRDFLTIDTDGNVELHYSTIGKTELQFKPSNEPIASAAFSPKSNGIVIVNARRQYSLYRLDNPHPETTAKSLFGKVWYEGYPRPEFVWQSTGGSDEFEPKLSLIPLMFGTVKGTLYAMLFSIPIALLAALYVSQFAPYWMVKIVKPTVELMAAIPSVVIGFLAGLYFSTLFEKYLMSILLLLISTPIIFTLALVGWRLIPERHRLRVPVGWELLFGLPVLLAAVMVSFSIGHTIELWLFQGNFQQWLYKHLSLTYETRNSFVVGFALGFAVIPIMFTVAEDALSNVPDSLASASLALGASRWQTVRRIIIPAAAGGIFAAVMLGLGRAVGETMIVLMATGNTPILDLSPFNGFRAMSACIAVEMPEAPVGGTLYRVLFLTGLLLFAFTFVLNTLSSIIGENLRKKYARF